MEEHPAVTVFRISWLQKQELIERNRLEIKNK